MDTLPTEMLLEILQWVSFTDQYVFRRVCQTWNQLLTEQIKKITQGLPQSRFILLPTMPGWPGTPIIRTDDQFYGELCFRDVHDHEIANRYMATTYPGIPDDSSELYVWITHNEECDTPINVYHTTISIEELRRLATMLDNNYIKEFSFTVDYGQYVISAVDRCTNARIGFLGLHGEEAFYVCTDCHTNIDRELGKIVTDSGIVCKEQVEQLDTETFRALCVNRGFRPKQPELHQKLAWIFRHDIILQAYQYGILPKRNV